MKKYDRTILQVYFLCIKNMNITFWISQPIKQHCNSNFTMRNQILTKMNTKCYHLVSTSKFILSSNNTTLKINTHCRNTMQQQNQHKYIAFHHKNTTASAISKISTSNHHRRIFYLKFFHNHRNHRCTTLPCNILIRIPNNNCKLSEIWLNNVIPLLLEQCSTISWIKRNKAATTPQHASAVTQRPLKLEKTWQKNNACSLS